MTDILIKKQNNKGVKKNTCLINSSQEGVICFFHYNDKSKSLFLFSNSNFLSYCASGKVPSFT